MTSIYEKAAKDLMDDGVCILRDVIPLEQVEDLRKSLEDVFNRTTQSQKTNGARTDMTKAANHLRSIGKGHLILEEKLEEGDTTASTGGRYLTELEAGRWHEGVKHFEHHSKLPFAVAQVLEEPSHLHFYMDHIFLKEAGSMLKTAWHQDAPYFPFECNANDPNPGKAAVCWVPVDIVAANSGGMRYIKGSHKWREYAPNVLITNDAFDQNRKVPCLPDIYEGIKNGKYTIIQFQNVKPGDVIIHHPNCVHGSGAIISSTHRRLAASIRYVGSNIKWLNKSINPNGYDLVKHWSKNREANVLMVISQIIK